MHKAVPIVVGVVGALVVILAGVLGWVVVPDIIEDKIEEKTRLINGTDSFEKWSKIPYPIYLSFYIHHITNPDEVEQGEKPKFKEVGPYSFLQTREKLEFIQDDIRNPKNTLKYKEKKTYFYDEKMSQGNNLNDTVNVINLPFVAVVSGLRDKNLPVAIQELVANIFLVSESLVRRDVEVGELLFDGFDVSVYTKNPILAPQLPEEFSNDRFGIYKGENGTLSLEYNVFTGVDDSKDFGRIKTYDGSEQLGFWVPGTECDIVKGTDGTISSPFLTKDRKFDVFSSDMCRSLNFEFDKETVVRDIDTYRFVVPKWTLEDPRINKENQCYCLTEKLEDCLRAGTISLSGCKDGAPIVMSTPYFLDGYEGYREDAGLPDPIEEKHQTYLDLEPNSGVLLSGHKRIQVNIDLKVGANTGPYIQAFQHLKKDMIFPLLWADEFAEIDESSADELKSMLITPMKIVDGVKWAGIGVGAVLAIVGLALFYHTQRKSVEVV